MALTTYGYIGGITSLAIITLSYFCSILFLIRYANNRRFETLLQGILFFAIGSNWLGVLISFLNIVLFGGEPLSHVPMIRSWSWGPPATATIWIFQTFSLIRPKLRNAAATVYLAFDAVYIYLVYFKTVDYTQVELVGGLPDSIIEGVAAVLLLFYILSILVIGLIYLLWIGLKFKRPTTQLRGKVIGVGVVLFAFFALFDTIIPPSPILLVISRVIILIAIFLMYLGLTLPEWLRRRFQVEETAAA